MWHASRQKIKEGSNLGTLLYENDYFLLVSLYNSLPLASKKFIHSNDEAQDQSISLSTVPKLTLKF